MISYPDAMIVVRSLNVLSGEKNLGKIIQQHMSIFEKER